MTNLLLKAARKKYRFKTPKGLLNLEQLFDLTQQQLHDLYLSLESSIPKSKGLLGKKEQSDVEDKLGIVEAVFNYLADERKEKEALANQKAMKAKVLDAIDEKEMDVLKSKSIKELKKIAKKL